MEEEIGNIKIRVTNDENGCVYITLKSHNGGIITMDYIDFCRVLQSGKSILKKYRQKVKTSTNFIQYNNYLTTLD